MRIILRQFGIALFTCTSLCLILLGITFLIFPIDHWSLLYTTKLYNVSYPIIAGTLVLFFATILAVFSSQLWRQHLHYVERQLEQLLHDQTLLNEAYKDLEKIESLLYNLQNKNEAQVEHAQHLATERANEREQSLQEVVVQERNRLARDLHDSVSQQLFAASMMMSAINEDSQIENDTLQHQINLVEKMIHQSQLEMRALLLHLRPVALKGKSIQDGMNDLLIELKERVPIEFKTHFEEFSIEKGIEDQLFRILQEAMSNSLRHSEATMISVSLIQRDSFIILQMTDNGKGFEMEKTTTNSYGLETMRERTQDLGGHFKLITLPDNGTRITVKIPTIRRKGDLH